MHKKQQKMQIKSANSGHIFILQGKQDMHLTLFAPVQVSVVVPLDDQNNIDEPLVQSSPLWGVEVPEAGEGSLYITGDDQSIGHAGYLVGIDPL